MIKTIKINAFDYAGNEREINEQLCYEYGAFTINIVSPCLFECVERLEKQTNTNIKRLIVKIGGKTIYDGNDWRNNVDDI